LEELKESFRGMNEAGEGGRFLNSDEGYAVQIKAKVNDDSLH